MISTWSKFIYVFGTLLILSPLLKCERCFDDTNCKDGEFCDKDQYNHFTVCRPCLSCKDYYKKKYDAMTVCVKSIRDCGKCIEGFELGIDDNGEMLPACLPTPPPRVDSGLSSNNPTNDTLGQMNVINNAGEYSSAKSAGIIAGAVALAVVGIAAIALGAFYGFKYYRGKIEKHDKKKKTEEKTVELQELKPQPTEVLTVDETKSEQKIERQQKL